MATHFGRPPPIREEGKRGGKKGEWRNIGMGGGVGYAFPNLAVGGGRGGIAFPGFSKKRGRVGGGKLQLGLGSVKREKGNSLLKIFAGKQREARGGRVRMFLKSKTKNRGRWRRGRKKKNPRVTSTLRGEKKSRGGEEKKRKNQADLVITVKKEKGMVSRRKKGGEKEGGKRKFLPIEVKRGFPEGKRKRGGGEGFAARIRKREGDLTFEKKRKEGDSFYLYPAHENLYMQRGKKGESSPSASGRGRTMKKERGKM